jgi:hypothetical protein
MKEKKKIKLKIKFSKNYKDKKDEIKLIQHIQIKYVITTYSNKKKKKNEKNNNL